MTRLALVLLAAATLLVACGKRPEEELTNQQIQDAQKRVKDLEHNRPK